jgi:pilus assembly protein CpaE
MSVRPPGRVATVLAAKGGCGRTTLATNLAAVLGESGTRSVCLVDLDLTFGDVAGMLSVQPRRTLVDAVELAGRLNQKNVHKALTTSAPVLDCVLAPTAPGAHVPVALVGELLTTLAWLYDHVVVDTPATLTAHTLAALDASHQHIVVATPDRPALAGLRRTLDVLDMLPYDHVPRHIVLNRCDERVGLGEAEIDGAVKHPVAARLPSCVDVPAAVNLGVPLAMSRPEHPYSDAVRRLASEHVAAPRFSRDET